VPLAPRDSRLRACAARTAVREQHLFASFLVGFLEILPPFRDLGIDFAAVTAQYQKIVCGTKARVGENAVWPASGASEEARLQCPDILHVRTEAPRDR